ncbi:MAG: response regulator [Phycisphaerales bacterium]|nr:response regulator [Planctomycetota bacterium]MCH8508894.1 response regulator [Phycisphaerales bacterium]
MSTSTAADRDPGTAGPSLFRTDRELFASMNHTIRTPMTAILGFADLIEQELHEGDERTLREAVRTIRRNGQHLMDVVGAILDVSGIERGVVRPATGPVDLAGLCSGVLDEAAPECRSRGIGLRCVFGGGVPARLVTDGQRVRQMLNTLVANAIRHTESGGIELRVSVRTREAGGDEICFDVIDSGIGMTDEQTVYLADPSVAPTNAEGVSIGLGLSLCHAYARLLGGRIEIRSQLGAGSRFGVVLPLDVPDANEPPIDTGLLRPAAGAGGPAPREFLPLAGGRVLLVEDGPDNQMLLRFLLHKSGADVELAADGQEALAFAADTLADYDLILMDMHMPRMDGYAATGRLRGAGCALPIIALTANALDGDRERCLNAGCDDYLPKPIDHRKLIEVCKQWMLGDRRRAV